MVYLCLTAKIPNSNLPNSILESNNKVLKKNNLVLKSPQKEAFNSNDNSQFSICAPAPKNLIINVMEWLCEQEH